MKAAYINKYGSPDVFELGELKTPEVKPDQVLVKIFASSINPMDYKTRQGNHKYILGSHFPIVLGYDFAGIVYKAGSDVTRFKEGDKVHGRSDMKYGRTYAQYGVTSENTLTFFSKKLSFEEAATVPLAALTALQALRNKGGIKKGGKVLVTGASGGVGHFAVQMIKYYGAHCTAICSTPHIEYVKTLNPDEIIDYRTRDFHNLKDQFDIIFDAAGKSSYLKCKHMLKRNGVFITTLPRPKLLFHKFISLFNKGIVKTLIMKAVYQDMDFVNQLIDDGYIKVRIDKIFDLDNISEAHKYAELGHTEGKIVIKIVHE